MFSISCAGRPTVVRVHVQYDDAWALAELAVHAGARSQSVAPVHELVLLVPDELAGAELVIALDGLRGATRYATGRAPVVPELGAEIDVAIALERIPCGAWCTPGATSCDGDAVVVCEQSEDLCLAWGSRVPCAGASCSLGACRASCVDECAQDEARCAGPGALQRCGEADSDACLDWLGATSCAANETCSNGACAAQCADECTLGEVQCRSSGLVRCGDLDRNGCSEWGPIEPCPSDQSCESGACRPIADCTDECTTDACAGDTFSRCGNFDLDPCLERSPGTTCASPDPCSVGSCTTGGCTTLPLRCDAPPASYCVDASTLRVYGAGTCRDGACEYAPSDRACPSCPSCDACAGVTCDTPPSVCYASAGTCAGGVCSYAYADGASCDDRNPCTAMDTCTSGTCRGTDMRCDTPPAPACLDATTLRTYRGPGGCALGACSYAYTDETCTAGCSAGACVSTCDDRTCACTRFAPVCRDATTLVGGWGTDAGVCTGATCVPFGSHPCAAGCVAGACVDPAPSICAGAAAAPIGTPVTGTIATGAPSAITRACALDGAHGEAIYRVDVPDGAFLLAEETACPSCEIEVRGPSNCDGSEVVECDSGTNRAVTSDVLLGGRYNLIVDGAGAYSLLIRLGTALSLGAACDPFSETERCGCRTYCLDGHCTVPSVIVDQSPNEAFCQAQGPLTADFVVDGQITSGSDYDTFAFTLASTRDAIITTTDGDFGCGVDTFVRVYAAMGRTCSDLDAAPPAPIATDNNSGLEHICSRLTLSALPPGAYYVEVSRPAGTTSTGGYHLSVDLR